MRHLPTVARILLGLIFFGAGVAGLLMPVGAPPPETPEALKTFFAGILATKYFFPFLKTTEAACGALLLSGYFVPLALVILAPIVIHIFLIHALIAPSGLPLAIILGVLETYLAFFAQPYRVVIRQLFIKNS